MSKELPLLEGLSKCILNQDLSFVDADEGRDNTTLYTFSNTTLFRWCKTSHDWTVTDIGLLYNKFIHIRLIDKGHTEHLKLMM